MNAWKTWARNWFWPALFAVLAAVATVTTETLQGGDPLDLATIGTAAALALCAWFLTIFKRTAGPDQPFIEPKKPPYDPLPMDDDVGSH